MSTLLKIFLIAMQVIFLIGMLLATSILPSEEERTGLTLIEYLFFIVTGLISIIFLQHLKKLNK